MTIGEILMALERFDPSAEIIFDFCGCYPTDINSSRGSYDEPALGWASGWSGPPPTVDSLRSELTKAIDGRAYTGYKGGEYRFSKKSPLCVDNYGKWTETVITGIEQKFEGLAIIRTSHDL